MLGSVKESLEYGSNTFMFSVQVYYSNNVDKRKEELKDRSDKKEQHLILTPSFSRVELNQDGLRIALYDM